MATCPRNLLSLSVSWSSWVSVWRTPAGGVCCRTLGFPHPPSPPLPSTRPHLLLQHLGLQGLLGLHSQVLLVLGSQFLGCWAWACSSSAVWT